MSEAVDQLLAAFDRLSEVVTRPLEIVKLCPGDSKS